ncbi:hypothetical protein ACO0K9_18895 [Undibacterium sp. Ji50W]|uniref:hypothetical protein n=1 Tax=Undibacterium sp. Ji50W TaxID=3413041 RepID=UPI003BF076C9
METKVLKLVQSFVWVAMCLVHQFSFAENDTISFSGARNNYGEQQVSFVSGMKLSDSPLNLRGRVLISRHCRSNLQCTSLFDVEPGSLISLNGKQYRIEETIPDVEMRKRIIENSKRTVPLVGLVLSDLVKMSRLPDSGVDQDKDAIVLKPNTANLQIYDGSKTSIRLIVNNVTNDPTRKKTASIEWQTGNVQTWFELNAFQLNPKVHISSIQLGIGDVVDLPIVGKLRVMSILDHREGRTDGGVVMVLD